MEEEEEEEEEEEVEIDDDEIIAQSVTHGFFLKRNFDHLGCELRPQSSAPLLEDESEFLEGPWR